MSKFDGKDFYSLSISPKNERESIDYGNALCDIGHYPAGLDGCFTVGISGGCGTKCFVYQDGKCDVPEEMIERLKTVEEKEESKSLYGAVE